MLYIIKIYKLLFRKEFIMKKAIFAASILAIAGCSNNHLSEKPITATPNVFSYGSNDAEHSITFDYFDYLVAPQFQKYKITLHLEDEPQRYTFDLCKELAEQSSCLSTVDVYPSNSNQYEVWVDYTVNLPYRVKDQNGNELANFTKVDEKDVEGIILIDHRSIGTRSYGNWGEVISEAKTVFGAKGKVEPSLVTQLQVITK